MGGNQQAPETGTTHADVWDLSEKALGQLLWHWREREPLTKTAYSTIVAAIGALRGELSTLQQAPEQPAAVEVVGVDPWEGPADSPHEQRLRDQRTISPPQGTEQGEIEVKNGEAMVCTGCGTTRTVAAIRAASATAFTWCPERKMVPVRDALRAHPSPAAGVGREVVELVETVDYLIGRLERVNRGEVVRDLPEAIGAYQAAKRTALLHPTEGSVG